MGLCKPADFNALEEHENTKKKGVYGVLPYISPEILYSFGIIMYKTISSLPPYNDVRHDEILGIKICQGLRPRFNIKVPLLIVHLIKRCLALNQPTAYDIDEILDQWCRGLEKE
ncbi:hypothetical protein C1645_862420 [Glomus cerebriforme]|uniref:Protein kinase domain-containing protein n=1 Tax=Glomus cerebriforme TaxID=658196 RepID=A0A397SD21_9GLOM|nr:hypothetical protein C1645_862420 [Glomus cerebriforme]